jgi:hypothetical protein
VETIPAKILNAIASSQKLKTEGARNLFRMTYKEKAADQEDQYHALLKAGVSTTVATNYQELAPLMAENKAISRYVVEKSDPELSMFLPEILNPREAMLIADKHRPMNPMERLKLAQMLTKLVGQIPSDVKPS